MIIAPQATKNPKVPLIIDCALAIMKQHGDHGLTMRQVAVRAGMSLSNLQYYFKNKNELLKGMVDFYFEKCAASFDARIAASEATGSRQRINDLIAFGLGQGESLTEICRIFRELWAIATRNEEINTHLEAYYADYAGKLSEVISPLTVHPDAVPRTVSLLLPYFEGYAITASVVPLDTGQIARMLTDIVISILEGDPARRSPVCPENS